MANFNWAQMLFDEPMATQGFRTTGNDPLNQFASWYQFGQNLRQGAEARRARKEAQEMARAEAQKYGNSNPQQGAIGVDASGVYGVNSTPAQPPVGIGADASGMYGVNGTPQQSKYTFNESDYIPSEGNGYHLGDYKQTEMYGNPTDFQRQMASNAIGYNFGSFEPRQQTWFPKDGNGTNPDNSMNITSQKIGQNYNGRIDGQVGGLNIPQSPQQNGFGSAINNAENPLNSFTGGSVLNFLNPVASGDSAQVAGGATNLSADNPFARSSRYLGADYDKMAYVKSALDSGVKNPLVAMTMYDQMIAPLRESAREDELRNAFFVLRNADPNSKEYNDAVSLIQYYKKDPYMEEDHQYKMGNVMNPDYGSGSTAGNAVLRALGDYTEGDQWMSPDGTGDSRTQCSNFVSDVLRKIGLNIGSSNGDELMKQFGSAYHTGIDGIQAGDVLNFKDHVGIYVGNGQYVARNSSGGVHQGSMEEAIQAFGQPLGYGSVGELTGTNRNRKYIKDPNRVTQREAYEYGKQKDAMNYALRNRAIDTRLAAKTGVKNGKINSTNGLWSSDDDIIGIFNKGALKENPASGQAMLSIVGQFAPKYRELIQRGLPPEQAKGAIQAALIKQLGADNIANMGKERFNDMMDSIINGTSSVSQQKNNSGHGGASGSNDGSVIDNVKAKGWDVIKNMIPENRENLNPDPYRNDVEDTAFEKADARRRVIEAARKEGLEFDELTNELRPIGGRWGNLFNPREKQEEINRKIASFKSRYAI